jgi:hypothetical protein
MGHEEPDPYLRPDGVDDGTVAAVGKFSEAIEWLERARGRLFDLHQMVGHLDFLVSEAADQLRQAGHARHATLLEEEVIGRNVIEGRWTFQVVDEFDRTYYEPVKAIERQIEAELLDGRHHVYEAELKEQRRSNGRPGHESRPATGSAPLQA